MFALVCVEVVLVVVLDAWQGGLEKMPFPRGAVYVGTAMAQPGDEGHVYIELWAAPI